MLQFFVAALYAGRLAFGLNPRASRCAFRTSFHHGEKPEMATAALQNVSKTEAIKKAASWRNKYMKVVEKGAKVGENVMSTAVTIGSAGAVGYFVGKMPGQWLGMDKELWIGGGALLMGLIGLGGPKFSDVLLNAGNGVLAAWTFNLARSKA